MQDAETLVCKKTTSNILSYNNFLEMLTKQSNGKVLRASLEKNGKDKDKAKIIRVQVRFVEVFWGLFEKIFVFIR